MGNDRKVRWGLLGAGSILDRIMKGTAQFDDMEFVAIASRTIESAKRMAERYNIPEVMESYEALVARDDIDVVYISAIHPAHKDLAIMAMNAGKAVLVEKPAAVNAADFAEMVECAKKNNVFLMEAFWMRFFPTFKLIKDVIKSGEIGDVRVIQAAFSFSQGENENPKGRLLDPNQAGGALLDVGIYTLHFANLLLDKFPVELTGLAAINSDENQFGVDETAGMVARFDKGELAMLTCGVRGSMPETGYIYGSKGHIMIPHFYKPSEVQVVVGEKSRTIGEPVPQRVEGVEDEGYQFEFAYVNECVRNGVKEPDVLPWSVTEEILKEADGLRAKWGLKYPFEK